MDNDIPEVDEFGRHELMDRAFFVMEILTLLKDHPAHTAPTHAAFEAADAALAEFYVKAAEERFKDTE